MEWTRRAKHTLGICNDEKRKELLEEGFVSGWKERLCKSMVRGGGGIQTSGRQKESDSDRGPGTSCLPFLCGREVEVRPGSTEGLRRL